VKQICKHGGVVNFSDRSAQVTIKGNVVMIARLVANNLYRVELEVPNIEVHGAEVKSNIDLWHERLGHLSESKMKELLQNNMMVGLDFKMEDHLSFCPVCSIGKQPRQKFVTADSIRTKDIGEVIHSDVCGPIRITSVGGASYFLTFIDDFSRKSWVYFLKRKSEVFEIFKNFRAHFRTQSGKPIKNLRSDGGGEYISKEFENWLSRKGIDHSMTPPDTPQLNGVAERLNRTLMDKARCLLSTSGVDKHFWAEAVNTANFLRNRSPTEKLKKITPEECFSGKKPVAVNLRIFGSPCLYTVNEKKTKLDARARKALFMGYAPERSAYRVYDIKQRKTVFSRDVKFNEMRNISEFNSETPKNDSQYGNMDVFDGQENSEKFKFSNGKTIKSSCINSQRDLLEGSEEGNLLPKCCSTEEDSSEVSEDEGVSNKETVYSKSGIRSSDTSAKFPNMEKGTPPQTPMKPHSRPWKGKLDKDKGKDKHVPDLPSSSTSSTEEITPPKLETPKSQKF